MAKYDISMDNDFSKYVDIAIKNCSCFFFLTSLPQGSHLVIEEISLANKYRKNIVPICIETFKMNSTTEMILKDIKLFLLKALKQFLWI